MHRNHAIVHQIHRLPSHVLAAALPHLRPYTAHDEVRNDLASWVAGARTDYASWQHAWNDWTRATPHRPGRVHLNIRCTDCHGRLFSTRRGIPEPCTTCRGRRRIHLHSAALWPPPPTVDEPPPTTP
jgi:hypothetical protein